MVMNYDEALQWLHERPRLAKSPGLERMHALMKALGNPQDGLKFVHVAGTNGKGSTVIMLSSILKQAGYKVGSTISPYVHDFRERILINLQMMPENVVAEALDAVKNAAGTLDEPIKEFEAVTAAAFYIFAKEKCEIVCVEAGIGGLNDSTNIIKNTLAACITKIDYDHTELLGDTISDITTNKCGIFKNKCAVISYPAQTVEAQDVIADKAEQAGCELVVPEVEDFYFYKESGEIENRLCNNRCNYGGYELSVPFSGRHQCLNAAVALEAALALCKKGFNIEDADIVKGIADAYLPARIEILSEKPLVILDGAHNLDSARALALTLKQAGVENLSVIMSMLADKEVEKVIEILSPYIYTLYTAENNSPRAMKSEELALIAKKHISNVYICDTVTQAIQTAKEDEAEKLLICGSFYIADEAKQAFI